MPSRPIAALIVLFWIGTLGWFGVGRDIFPKFRSGETPPFVIDLTSEVVAEVQKNHPADALWIIYRNGESIGTAKTFLLPKRRRLV